VHKKTTAVGALCLLAAACGAPKPRAPATATPSTVSAPPGANCRIDPALSELRLLVYRAGVMASFGHNHVIVNRNIEGWVSFAGDPANAAFALSVPASGFVVDETAARREEGEDFAEETPQDAKAGTLRNMLGPAVLDAEAHPAIELRSVSIHPSGGGFEATVAVSVAGHESELAVPFALDTSGGRLRASGAMSVRQSALGLTPFSVMLGALKVQDELEFKFRLVATGSACPRAR
jgi:YceI-like domain